MSLTEQLVELKLKQFAWDLDELDRQIHKLEPEVRKRVEQINTGSVEPFDVSNLTTITAAIQDALQSIDNLNEEANQSGLGPHLTDALDQLKSSILPLKSSAEDILKLEMAHRPPNYFNSLPTELVAHIFLIGVRDERHDPKDMARAPFNLIVSSVCQRWRDIALTTPTMWQYITMSEADPQYRWTKLWLERSKEAPLDIDLYWSSSDGPGLTDKETYQIRDILMPHAYRWREFSFNVDTFEPNHILLQALSGLKSPLPLFEDLMLYSNCKFDPDDDFTPIHLKSPIHVPSTLFPGVRRVELWGVHIAWESWPFKNLTRLALSYHTHDVEYTPAQFVSMLNSSPNLEYLKLNGSGPFPFDTNTAPPYMFQLTLPSLRALHLSFYCNPTHVPFLTHLLRAPNLESLTIKDWFDNAFCHIITLMGSSYKSRTEETGSRGSAFGYPSITRLSIGGIEVQNAQTGFLAFRELFRSMENVTYLTINCKEMVPETFQSLAVPPIVSQGEQGSQPDRVGDVALEYSRVGKKPFELLLPLLHTLKPIGMSWNAVSTLLSRRQEHGVPLSRVLIRRPAEDTPPIDEWKRFGCEIEFYDEDSEDEEEDDSDDDESFSSGWTTDPDDGDEDDDDLETEDDLEEEEEVENVGMTDGESGEDDGYLEVGHRGDGDGDSESGESSPGNVSPGTMDGLDDGSDDSSADQSVSTDELNL